MKPVSYKNKKKDKLMAKIATKSGLVFELIPDPALDEVDGILDL